MARMTIAALAAVLLLALAHQAAAGRELKTIRPPTCAPPTCPSGFKALYVGTRGHYGTSCGYECYTPVKMNCHPSIGGAYICGGTTEIPCPTIACAYSASYSISGPGGCAAARSKVDAFAFSNYTFNTAAGVMDPILKSYCDVENDNYMPLDLAVNETINALAVSIAETLAHYETYVCSCCVGNSAAYTVVKADIQAVATAQALAYQELLGSVRDCFITPYSPEGRLLAGAYAKAEAFAQDVQVAIDRVYKAAYSNRGFRCTAPGTTFLPKIKQAVAQAAACTFANIYAAAIDASHGGAAYACASTATISGSLAGPTVTCPLDLPCDCTPTDYQYNNLGFETGSFDDFGTAPAWNVINNGYPEAPPAIISQQNLKIGTTMKLLKPKEKTKMAVIPVGHQPNISSISTSFTVPPCASKIYASYVFKCNDQPSSPPDLYNDNAQFNIVVKNGLNGAVVTEYPVYEDCKKVGYTVNTSCSSDSAVADGGASNGGDWTDIEIPVAPGAYIVEVIASGKEIAGDPTCASKLYIDNIGFA